MIRMNFKLDTVVNLKMVLLLIFVSKQKTLCNANCLPCCVEDRFFNRFKVPPRLQLTLS